MWHHYAGGTIEEATDKMGSFELGPENKLGGNIKHVWLRIIGEREKQKKDVLDLEHYEVAEFILIFSFHHMCASFVKNHEGTEITAHDDTTGRTAVFNLNVRRMTAHILFHSIDRPHSFIDFIFDFFQCVFAEITLSREFLDSISYQIDHMSVLVKMWQHYTGVTEVDIDKVKSFKLRPEDQLDHNINVVWREITARREGRSIDPRHLRFFTFALKFSYRNMYATFVKNQEGTDITAYQDMSNASDTLVLWKKFP